MRSGTSSAASASRRSSACATSPCTELTWLLHYATLAFVRGADCHPSWADMFALDDAAIRRQIAGLRADGGDVVISSGGAVGPFLETTCADSGALASAYIHVLDTLDARHLDVDL